MHQASLHNGAKVHFYRGVLDIARNLGARLKLKKVAGMNRTYDRTVYHDMGHGYLALDAGMLA